MKASCRSTAVAAVMAIALVVAGCGGGGSGGTGGGGGGKRSASTVPASTSGSQTTVAWPSVGEDTAGTRYSPSKQITASNVSHLKLSFNTAMDPEGVKTSSGGEDNPIEANGVLYAASSSSEPTIGAYQAATGKVIWQKTSSELGVKPGKNSTGERGLAIGGGLLYVELPGGILVGIDQKTGEAKWHRLINTQHVFAYSQPTPVYADGLVFIGQSGSDIIGGLEGFVKAVDAKTGKLAWKFDVLPKPGTPGAKTWASPQELTDGGGGVWTNAVVDEKLGLVYFPTGNPWPDIGGRGPGADYYTDGVVALDIHTGKLRWFYQTTHHDEWDYDCAQPPVLWTQKIGGKTVNGLSIGCKNGYVYELDRETGKPVTPVREEPLDNAKTDPQAKAFDEAQGWKTSDGKALTEPIPVNAGEVTAHCASKKLLPHLAPDDKPYEYSCAYIYYSNKHYTAGWNGTALDWAPASYNPQLGYTYYCANVGVHAAKYKNLNAKETSEIKVFPQLVENGEGEGMVEPREGWLTALNLQNDKTVWQNRFGEGVECAGGTSTTASGLVFGSNSSGKLLAFDAKTGKQVWSYTKEGLGVDAPPIIYTVDGTQYVVYVVTVEGKAALLGFALNAKEPAPLVPKSQTPAEATSGQSVFTSNCGSCHTLAAAETAGTIGPDLDQLKPSEATVEHQVIHGGDRMPSFQKRLSTAQIKAVAEYVSEVAGKSGEVPAKNSEVAHKGGE